MKNQQFIEISSIESSHFWYKARREIIETTLKHFKLLDNHLSVLEIGSANGTNIKYFRNYYTKMKGMEINDEALKIAQSTVPDVEFKKAWLPYNLCFEDEKFDLIFLLDVLEHVEDDIAALIEIYKRLNHGGILVVTVPAYQFLFGGFDVYSHHFRRYNKQSLNSVVKQTGFASVYTTYFNFFLFPLVLISRLLEKLMKKNAVGIKMPGRITNWLFYKIMSSEKNRISKAKSYPCGSSLIMLLKKK